MKASGGFVQTSCLKSARAARAFPNSSAKWSAGWPTVSDFGWLVDAFTDSVWVYREGQPEPERLERPMILSGESVMEGLSVDLTHVWRAESPQTTA